MFAFMKQSSPLLRNLDSENPEKTGKVFELAKKRAAENGLAPDFMDLTDIKYPSHKKKIKTQDGETRKKQVYKDELRTIVQWRLPGLTEEQFEQLEQTVRGIKSPHKIKSRVDYSGKKIRPTGYPTFAGKKSTKQRGYFIHRLGDGIWVAREFRNGREARKAARKQGWLFGEGPHLIELREEEDMRQLHFIEYMAQISRILGGKKPKRRDRVIYESYKDLVQLDIKPKSREQIVGLDEIIEDIKWLMWSPSQNPKAAEYYRTKDQSVLLAGVPGVGKTLVAEVLLGEELDSLFIPVSAQVLVESKSDEYEDDSPKSFFNALSSLQSQAKVMACLYCDDIESVMLDPMQSYLSDHYLANSSTLLNRLAGMQANPYTKLSGSTNDPALIDPRFLEFGRVGYIVHVPLPKEQARRLTFELHSKGQPLKGVRFDELIKKTEGYTNRNIEEICNTASRLAMRRAAEKIRRAGETAFDALKRLTKDVMEETPITQDDYNRAFVYVSEHTRIEQVRKLDNSIANFCENYNQGRIGFRAFK